MSTPYGKACLSLHDQAELLESRGPICIRAHIDDLAHPGYHHLSDYWDLPRSVSLEGERPHYFFEDPTCDDLLDIHHIELHLRVTVRYELGKLGPFAPASAAQSLTNAPQKFDQFRKSLLNLQARSKGDFVQHHQHRYDGQMPFWVATEIMQPGQLVTLYKMTPFGYRAAIADHFGARAQKLRSWLKAINMCRNVVAHHGHLSKPAIGMKPQLNRRKADPLLDHARTSADRA